MKLLLVDDHPLIQDAFRYLVPQLGPDATLLQATSAEAGLRAVRAGGPAAAGSVAAGLERLERARDVSRAPPGAADRRAVLDRGSAGRAAGSRSRCDGFHPEDLAHAGAAARAATRRERRRVRARAGARATRARRAAVAAEQACGYAGGQTRASPRSSASPIARPKCWRCWCRASPTRSSAASSIWPTAPCARTSRTSSAS